MTRCRLRTSNDREALVDEMPKGAWEAAGCGVVWEARLIIGMSPSATTQTSCCACLSATLTLTGTMDDAIAILGAAVDRSKEGPKIGPDVRLAPRPFASLASQRKPAPTSEMRAEPTTRSGAARI